MSDHSLRMINAGLMAFGPALELQKRLVRAKKGGVPADFLVLVEHPSVITLGRTADERHLLFPREELAARGIEVFEVERGGDVTYHGPGQLVGYPILDLKRAGLGVSDYLRFLESVIVEVLGAFGVRAFARAGLTGVWTDRGKIAAIGVAVTRWISYHGFAINVDVEPSAFDAIVPCGLSGESVTSILHLTGSRPGVGEVGEKAASVIAGRLGLAIEREAFEGAAT